MKPVPFTLPESLLTNPPLLDPGLLAADGASVRESEHACAGKQGAACCGRCERKRPVSEINPT